MSIKITRRFTQILDFHFNSIYLLEFRAKANDVYATIVELLVGSNVVISSLVRPIRSVGVVIYHYARRVAFRASMDFRRTLKWAENRWNLMYLYNPV